MVATFWGKFAVVLYRELCFSPVNVWMGFCRLDCDQGTLFCIINDLHVSNLVLKIINDWCTQYEDLLPVLVRSSTHHVLCTDCDGTPLSAVAEHATLHSNNRV